MSIQKVAMAAKVLDVRAGWSMALRATQPGPPVRVDGLTLGIVAVEGDPPHGGEMHPDGDEFLYVISGRLRVSCDSQAESVELGPGEGCIVPRGEWHQVQMIEPAVLLHATPGPDGAHRNL